MSTTKFTPGPWFSVTRLSGSENHHGFKICGNDGWALAEVMPVDEDGIRGKANAHLIAAAPDLYEALEECADELTAWISDRYPESDLRFPSIQKDFQLDMSVVDKARAALAKARGESHD